MGQLYDLEGPLGHKRPTGMMSILGPPCSTVTPEAEERGLALEGHLPGGRAPGALCAERPFLTSSFMELRVPQVRLLPACLPSLINLPSRPASHIARHLAAHAP